MTMTPDVIEVDDTTMSASLGLRPCDLPALRSVAEASRPEPDAAPLRVQDLIHSRLRSAACDDMIDPRKLLTARPHPVERSVAGLPLIDLPEPAPLPEVPLGEVIERRHSSTTHSSEPLPLATLAGLLDGAAGVRDRRYAYNTRNFPFRRAPSAGGLAPVDIFVVSNAVDGGAAFAGDATTALRHHLAARSDEHDTPQLLAGITTGPADLEDLYLIRTGRHYA